MKSIHAFMRRCRRAVCLLMALMVWVMPALAGLNENPAYVQPEETQVVETVSIDNPDLVAGYAAEYGATLNPFYCTQQDLISINQLVFESLVELDENGKPTALLADTWSHEGKEWTFNLRQGVMFHNGYEFTAYDVVASYNAFLQSTVDNPYTRRIQYIATMEAVDMYTLHVTGKYEGYITLYAMTFPIVQELTVWDDMPRGSGPYWFIYQEQDSYIYLEANALWWKRQPNIRNILFLRYADTAQMLEALTVGDIDMFTTRSATAALTRKLSNVAYVDYSTTTYDVLVPCLHSSSIMSKVELRQAVMYAIDAARIVQDSYHEMAQQCEVPVLSNSWIYESQSAVYYYSPERALQLLLADGWEDLTGDGKLNKMDGIMLVDLSVNIITYSEPSGVREKAAEQIAAYLEAVGFKVEVEVLSKTALLSRMEDREYDLALVSMNLSEFPSLVEIFYEGRALNLNNHSNETMDALLVESFSAQTEEEFRQAMSDLQMYVVERLPVMGVCFRTGVVLSSRSLGGLTGGRGTDAFSGMEYLERLE